MKSIFELKGLIIDGFTEDEIIVVHGWINKQIGPVIDKIGSN